MTPERFTGFGPAVTDWFVALSFDNSRDYWAATKDVWQRDVRDPLEAMLLELASGDAKRLRFFRPHRDLRFARDAAPLKTATGGVLYPADRSASGAARYAAVSARGLIAVTGYHVMAPDQLARYREAAAGTAGDALAAALEEALAAGLELGGEVLRGVPRGVPRDHPRVDLLKRKALTAGAWMPPGDALLTREPLAFATHTWDAAAPVVTWLDRHVGPTRLGPDEAQPRPRARR